MPLSYCHNYSVPLRTDGRTNDNKALITRARCKLWSCPYCAEINRRVWMGRIGLHIEKNQGVSWTFFTFTLMGKHHTSAVASLIKWREIWDSFIKRLKREYGKFEYLRLFEPHKDGVLHVHMLAGFRPSDVEKRIRPDTSEYWHSEAVKQHLIEVGAGYIHDCKPLEHDAEKYPTGSLEKAVAGYMAKYLTKETQGPLRETLRGAGFSRVRIIQTSRGWEKLPSQTKQYTWLVGPMPWSEASDHYRHGTDIADLQTKRKITGDDYEDYDYYPNQTSDLLDWQEDSEKQNN